MVTVDEDASEDDQELTSQGEELLARWQERFSEGEAPMAALASVLSNRTRRREELFSRIGQTVLGYKLVRILGAGGSGVTYSARTENNEQAAVKLVVLAGGSSEARFERECQLLQGFSHSAIVGYKASAIIEPGVGALAMDLVEGADLEQILRDIESNKLRLDIASAMIGDSNPQTKNSRPGPTFERRILSMLANVAEGLSAVHSAGAVHRDIKPANILVNQELSPTLIDFGLAQDASPHNALTMSGVAIGTLFYMAPEQLRTGKMAVGNHTDTYALGLVLYRALLGHLPQNDVQELASERQTSIRLSSDDRSRLPQSAQIILRRALQHDPRRRYRTAEEMASHLDAASRGEKVPRFDAYSVRVNLTRTGIALLAATILLTLISYWPQSQRVEFVANCHPENTFVEIDGESSIPLNTPIDLYPGVYEVSVVAPGLVSNEYTVHIEDQGSNQTQTVPLLVLHGDDFSKAQRSPPGHSLLHFMTGYTFEPFSSDLGQDKRWIDGSLLTDVSPYDQGLLTHGEHLLTAEDAKGRTESQRITVGPFPLDVQLLPKVIAHVDGHYRTTWSTILSPLPRDLEIQGNVNHWYGSAQESTVGGGGLMAMPCALAPRLANVPSEALITCHFPEPMRSAVVYLQTECGPNAELNLSTSFGDDAFTAWPQTDNGSITKMVALRAETGATSLVIRAQMKTPDPLSGRANVNILNGMLFGGHWNDEPPCLAIVADRGSEASLDNTLEPNLLEEDLRLSLTDTVSVSDLNLTKNSIDIACLHIPQHDPELLITGKAINGTEQVIRLGWPDLNTEQTLLLKDALGKMNDLGQLRLNSAIHSEPIGDVNGDGVSDIAICNPAYSRGGYLFAGKIGVVNGSDLGLVWRAPENTPNSLYGDVQFGASIAPLQNTKRRDCTRLAVCSPAYRNKSGMQTGRISIHNAKTGKQEWQTMGTSNWPALHVEGAWSFKGSEWLLVKSFIWTLSTSEMKSNRFYAHRIGADNPSYFMMPSEKPLKATVCASSESSDVAIVLVTTLDDRSVKLQRLTPDDQGLQWGKSTILEVPKLAADVTTKWYYDVKPCADLDGDNLDDFVVEIPSAHATAERDHAVALISSRTLEVLAWADIHVSAGKTTSHVITSQNGGKELVMTHCQTMQDDDVMRFYRFRLP